MTARGLVLGVLITCGCAHGVTQRAAASDADSLRVSMKLVEVRDEKPPKASYLFDVVIDNAGEATWILFPRAIDRTGLPTTGGVTGLEPRVCDDAGRVILGEALGSGGFVALRAPSQAHLIVRRFPIAAYSLPSQPLTLELVTARNVTVGGEALEEWFPSDPSSDAQAIVDDAHAKRLSARHTPDHREVPALAQSPRTLLVTAQTAR